MILHACKKVHFYKLLLKTESWKLVEVFMESLLRVKWASIYKLISYTLYSVLKSVRR